jgi:hypothetical protein
VRAGELVFAYGSLSLSFITSCWVLLLATRLVLAEMTEMGLLLGAAEGWFAVVILGET